jgi:hypothetical protein
LKSVEKYFESMAVVGAGFRFGLVHIANKANLGWRWFPFETLNGVDSSIMAKPYWSLLWQSSAGPSGAAVKTKSSLLVV